MSEDEFTKLFKYIQREFTKVNEKLDKMATQESLNKLTNTVVAFVARIDKYETEMAMRDRQFERLLEWARKVSEKTGIPLESL